MLDAGYWPSAKHCTTAREQRDDERNDAELMALLIARRNEIDRILNGGTVAVLDIEEGTWI